MQMMHQASNAQQDPESNTSAVATGTSSEGKEEATGTVKMETTEAEGSESAKVEEKKVEAKSASDELPSPKAEL